MKEQNPYTWVVELKGYPPARDSLIGPFQSRTSAWSWAERVESPPGFTVSWTIRSMVTAPERWAGRKDE